MMSSIGTNPKLLNLVRFLATQYFTVNNYCTVIYHDHTLNTKQSELLGAVDQVISSEQLPVVWITTGTGMDQEHVEKAIELGCQSYVVVTKNVNIFFETKLIVMDRTSQRKRDKFFLIFVESIIIMESNRILEETFNFYPNLWFMSPSVKLSNGYDFYTQNFTVFDSAKLYYANSFNLELASFTSNATLFYDKHSNLGGRPIRTGIVDYVPYATTEFVGPDRGNADVINSNRSKELLIDGSEGTLMVEFCIMYNCNLKMLPFGADNWGYINDTGVGEGMLNSPLIKETEIIISTVFYQWIYKFLDYSSPIVFASILIMVPRAKLLPTVLTPLYPFNPSLWLTIFISLIVMMAVHYFIMSLNLFRERSSKSPLEKSIFDMISIYLDQAIIHNKSTLSYRVLISCVLMSGVVLSNSYAGGLASVLTVPRYEKSLETIHDFAQSAYRWGDPAIAWILAIVDAESVDLKTVVSKFDNIPDVEELYERSLPGDFGIGIEYLTCQKINVGPYIREDNVHLFELPKQMLYYSYTTVASQRGWPIMEQLSHFILVANQHGLVLHWEKRTLRQYQTTRLEVALDPTVSGHQKDVEIQALTVEHIFGPMFILIVGTTFATGIFLLEIMWYSLCTCFKKWKNYGIISY